MARDRACGVNLHDAMQSQMKRGINVGPEVGAKDELNLPTFPSQSCVNAMPDSSLITPDRQFAPDQLAQSAQTVCKAFRAIWPKGVNWMNRVSG
ncbi:hypothetical protein DBV39_02355 [Orrella marina]|uniref:Uncharacterized protein n=1 Tax=Orrella marina TaxID=2163011 RepID=A0A2R4XG10_9BURK|nr:hypothetical protein DBV39_02355 [Orrella marina]